jgi:hypothetical protein
MTPVRLPARPCTASAAAGPLQCPASGWIPVLEHRGLNLAPQYCPRALLGELYKAHTSSNTPMPCPLVTPKPHDAHLATHERSITSSRSLCLRPQTLAALLPPLGERAGPSLGTLVPLLASAAGCAQAGPRMAANAALDALSAQRLDAGLLVQHFAAAASGGPSRGRATLVDRLAVLAQQVRRERPSHHGRQRRAWRESRRPPAAQPSSSVPGLTHCARCLCLPHPTPCAGQAYLPTPRARLARAKLTCRPLARALPHSPPGLCLAPRPGVPPRAASVLCAASRAARRRARRKRPAARRAGRPDGACAAGGGGGAAEPGRAGARAGAAQRHAVVARRRCPAAAGRRRGPMLSAFGDPCLPAGASSRPAP